MQDEAEGRIYLAVPADSICRIFLSHSRLHLGLVWVPFLALLLPSLTSSPSIGLWYVCWSPWSFSAHPSSGRGRVAPHSKEQ